ncbi:hypothetical protein BaRGS_00011000 [Batillaria attramentaria]|uniref:Chitin-binding type-4 domain-containing protein n=1 Tax=Batillaria attramentaria TaxID=370345 RepID=A0ABD0LF95_9CAEN
MLLKRPWRYGAIKPHQAKTHSSRISPCTVSGFVVILLCVGGAWGGSRLIEPPARQSLWRYGFGTPVNFYDDDVNCGGFNTHHVVNNGLCGVCGDAWDSPQPRDHEAGGKISPNPLPVRAYQKGSFISVAVDSSADLLGKYEFRLCKLNTGRDTPTQDCFDQTRLTIREAEFGQSYQIGQSGGLVSLHLQLPDTLVCSHCILQWRHVTGYKINRQNCVQCGTEPPKCTFCKGCGSQEWYQGCVDIAVYDTVGTHPALAGVRTQQELKDQWEATLAAYNNCTCPSGNSVSGSTKTSSSPNDNTINNSYPYPESTSPTVSRTTVSVVTSLPATTASNGNQGSSGQIQPVTTPSSQTVTTSNNNNVGNTGSQVTIPATTSNAGGTTQHRTFKPPAVVTNPSKPTLNPGNGFNSGGYRPVFNNQWTNQWARPQHSVCYIPHRAPPYMRNARRWCAQNCPHRRVYCNYYVCRPVACSNPTQTRRTAQRNFSWLLPFLFMDGLELR